MRILWHSNAPFVVSAYGLQTALFVPRLAALGHEIIISAPHSFAGSPVDWKNFRVIPAAGDPIGNDIIVTNYKYYQADLLLTLCDIFKLVPSAKQFAEINVAHWVPVDCDPLGEGDVMVLREGMGTPIAMTHFGQWVMANEGLYPHYIPHGVDTKVFQPGQRQEVRESMGFSEDDFIIGICAMNRDPVRKGLVEQVTAFREFHQKHPDSKLLMHTMPSAEPGLQLEKLVRRLDFPPDVVMFPDVYTLATGLVTSEMMAAWYCGLDILSSCSYAEGFGMPVLEAQACSVPVVVTDFSGTGEMCLSGWKIPGEKHWINGHGSWWRRPAVGDIANAYETAWQAKCDGKMPKMRKAARNGALAFDADRVTKDFWAPVLSIIEAGLKGGLWQAAPLRSTGLIIPMGRLPSGARTRLPPPGWWGPYSRSRRRIPPQPPL